MVNTFDITLSGRTPTRWTTGSGLVDKWKDRRRRGVTEKRAPESQGVYTVEAR